MKKIYEKIPEKIKFVLGPVLVKVMVYNPVFKETYNELKQFDQMDEMAQEKIQLNKLKEVLVYANQHVPYYMKLFQEVRFDPNQMASFNDIEKIPLLTKEKAIDVGEMLYSEEDIEYYTAYTGGSSGKSLKCLSDKMSYYKERAFFSHFLAPLGYDQRESRTVTFRGLSKGHEYYFSPVKADIAISPFRLFKEECFEDIFKLILDFQVDFITGYASAISYFAKQCQKRGKNIQLKGVVFTSENWSVEDQFLVEHTFGCKAVSCYGHTERAVFAAIYDGECVFNKLYGYTELIPTDIENEFQIACTGFLSKKMPLIRYVTDDVIQVTAEGRYKLIGHKKSEVLLIGKNGAPIFKGALTLHMAETQKVKTYQYVQNEVGKAELHIVQDEALSERELRKIQDYIESRCEELLEVEIRIVSEVKRTPRGKYIWAICNVI